jgi:hypothetical protein
MTRKEYYLNEIKEIEERKKINAEKKKTYKVGSPMRSLINYTSKQSDKYIIELKNKIKNL